MFTFLQMSDTHEDPMLPANLELLDALNVDAKIMCGDYAKKNITEANIDYSMFKDKFYCLGNHDTITKKGWDESPANWSKMLPQKELYEKFYKGKGGKAEIVEGKTWGYGKVKDVGIIIYNQQVNDFDGLQQLEWLRGLLDEIVADDTVSKYIVVLHMIGSHVDGFEDNSFTDYNYAINLLHAQSYYYAYPHLDEIFSILKDPKYNDKLMCVLAGHDHTDLLNTEYLGKPIICIGSVRNDGWNNVNRSPKQTSQAVINYFVYNGYLDTLTCYRLGAMHTFTNGLRGAFTYSFKEGKIVSIFSS